MADRIEYRSIEAARDSEGAVAIDAVLADRPIYRGGQILRSWQKRFVQTCVEDWRLHGKARYLIADDVGLGKTRWPPPHSCCRFWRTSRCWFWRRPLTQSSRGQSGRDVAKPNNLLDFIRRVAGNAGSVILGTATPIQLAAVELWDLMSALTQGGAAGLGKAL